jgi:hypothetical protein
MKRSNFISLITVFLLIFSILSSNLSKANVITISSNQLALEVGSYVEGKILYSNDAIENFHAANAIISVDRIFNTTDTEDRLVQITFAVDQSFTKQFDLYMIRAEYFLFDADLVYRMMDEGLERYEFTYLFNYDNRTTFLPLARLYYENTTCSIEVTLLDQTSVSGLMNTSNLMYRFSDGTEFQLGTINSSHPYFGYVDDYWSAFYLLSGESRHYLEWCLFGISPTTSSLSLVNSTRYHGTVVNDDVEIKTIRGKKLDTILVSYNDTSFIALREPYTVLGYYDTRTGLLIKYSEESDHWNYQKLEFIPKKVVFGSEVSSSFDIAISGIICLSLLVIFVKKRRKN